MFLPVFGHNVAVTLNLAKPMVQVQSEVLIQIYFA